MIALINDRVVATREADIQQLGMFSYVSVDERVPPDHPIRKLRVLVDTILQELDDVLTSRYAAVGRTSIPPAAAACLAAAGGLQRAQRAAVMEQLNYNLLSAGSSTCTISLTR